MPTVKTIKDMEFITTYQEDYETEYMGREYIMEMEASGTHYDEESLNTEGWHHVEGAIKNVKEWKEGGEYLEPVTDAELIKEIESSIDFEEELNIELQS